MNRHAEKLVTSESSDESRDADLDLGGVVEEVHCCPGCGEIMTRRVS
jgi:hypothetical protein